MITVHVKSVFLWLPVFLGVLGACTSMFQESPDFEEIEAPPTILRVEPDLIAPPMNDDLTITFTARNHVDTYEIYLNDVLLSGSFDPEDPSRVEQGNPITFTVYGVGHELYDERNNAIQFIPPTMEPQPVIVRGKNEFQYVNSDPYLVSFCRVGAPEVRGFMGTCPKTPCRDTAVVFLTPIEWMPSNLTFWYDYEIYEVDSPNTAWENIELAVNEISLDLWIEAFDEFDNIISPPEEIHKNHTYPLVGYGRTSRTFADLTLPNPDHPNNQSLLPGHYYIRVRAFNSTCHSDWSDPFMFHFYKGWAERPKSISMGGSFNQAEGIAVDSSLGRMYMGNNGEAPKTADYSLIKGAGNFNVQTFIIGDWVRANLGAYDGVFGFTELAEDDFGNNVDGITVDPDHNIYFVSDQTGYIYKYSQQLAFQNRIGRGVSVPHNPEKDSLFWDVAYYDGKLYATDANDYDDIGSHPRFMYIYDAETGDELDKIQVAQKVSTKSSSEMWGIAIDPCQELIYIADNDYAAKVVRVLELDGTELFAFEAGLFGAPIDVAVGCNGIVYVTDGMFARTQNNWHIWAFLVTRDFVRSLTWEEEPIILGERLYDLRGCAVDAWHNVYGAEGNRAVVFSPE